MIKIEKGKIEAYGGEIEILADFGLAVKTLTKFFKKDDLLEICLIGLFAEDRAQMDRIHEQLKEAGMDV